jgi:hypothetical protein
MLQGPLALVAQPLRLPISPNYSPDLTTGSLAPKQPKTRRRGMTEANRRALRRPFLIYYMCT